MSSPPQTNTIWITYVVNCTKKWLLGRGVNIEPVPRDDKTMLETSVTVQLKMLNYPGGHPQAHR